MATQTPPPSMQANGAKPDPITETWHPFSILSPPLPSARKFALIVLNQPLALPASIYPLLWANAHTKVGADGGANRVHRLNNVLVSKAQTELPLDTVIGDLDSLFPKVRMSWEAKGTEIVKVDDQDSTDFTKAVDHIRSRAPANGLSTVTNGTTESNTIREGERSKDTVVLGGLGGRVDQGLSVLHHLYMFQASPAYAEGRMYLLSSEAITFLLLPGKHRICVKAPSVQTLSEKDVNVGLGRHIGIIPMREPAVISTSGLKWDVENWETSFGGQMSTSNLVREEWVSVETDKSVLFTIDLDFGEEGDEEE